MCGIVAGVSGRDIVPVLVQGLQRLEYRGYDSCGVAVYGLGAQSGLRGDGAVHGLSHGVSSSSDVFSLGRTECRQAVMPQTGKISRTPVSACDTAG